MAQYTVTTAVTPAGSGYVDGGGTYDEYSLITLTATANSGYKFYKWNDESTVNPKEFLLTADVSYTAQFLPENACVLNIEYTASQGSVTGAGTYLSGDSVTITATATSPYIFLYWEDIDGGGIFADSATYTFTISTHLNLRAVFQIPAHYYTLKVKSNQPAMGRVSVNLAAMETDSEGYTSYNMPEGAQIRISAIANTGYRFSQWSDGQTANPYVFLAAADRTLSATFEVNPIVPEAATILQLQSSTGNINVGLTGTLVGTLLDPTLTYEFYWSVTTFDALSGASGTVFTWTPTSLTSTSVTLPIKDAFETLLPNSTSGSFYLGVVGRSSEAIKYQSNIPFTLNIVDGYKPTISLQNLTLSNTYNNLAIAGYTSFVTRYTDGVTPSNNSASIVGIAAQASKGYCEVSGSILKGITGTFVESLTNYQVYISATATDSRNRTATGNSNTVTVYGYHLPYFSLDSIAHCDASGETHEEEEQDQNTYVKIVFSLNVASIPGNSVTPSTIQLTIDDRTHTNCTLVNNKYQAIIGGGNLSPLANYSVAVRIYDTIMDTLNINPETFTVQLSKKIPISLLDDKAGKVGFAMGIEASQDDIIEMALDTSFTDNVNLIGNATISGEDKTATISSYDLIHNAVRAYEADHTDEGTYGTTIRIMTGTAYKKLKDNQQLDAHTIYFLSSPVTGV